MMTSSTEKKITKKDLWSAYLHNMSLEASYNYERQQSNGFAFAVSPILKKLYGDNKEKMSAAMQRHLEFFNTTPYVCHFITGITAAMEERNANDESFDESTINGVKASLMGPLAGIGDSLYWGTLRLIATGIGTDLALRGSILGPILFFLIFNIPQYLLSYGMLQSGYKLGVGFLSNLQNSGLMGKLTYGASILGLLVIGAMSASMIEIYVPFAIGSGEAATVFQEILDSIMPCLLPLGAFWLIYYLLGKQIKTTTILVGIFALSILGTGLGILGL